MSATVSVIGGANFDISARLTAPFVAADSNLGHTTLGYGGVARNIAHNLCLLGHGVRFVTVFGGDIFGGLCHDQCKHIGLDLSLSEQVKGERNGLYLCINNQAGDMIAAVADTEIIMHITPAFLEKRMSELNQSSAIVADTNISEESLRYLIDNSLAPLFVDAVSTAKAGRVVSALQKSRSPRLHTLKLNQKEALSVSGCSTVVDAAVWLAALGIEHIYITLGQEGVYCTSGQMEARFPSLPVEVVNTTGAGDAFLAGVVHAYLREVSFPHTAQYGLKAAYATLLSAQAVNPELHAMMNL